MNSTPEIQLSVIVPAYNEEDRLPNSLAKINNFLSASMENYEIIVVNDGSSDRTSEFAREFASGSRSVRILDIPHQGKAAAVRAGILASRGRMSLFTDTDLSTPIEYAKDIVEALEDGADVAIGTREGHESQRVQEPAYRHFMGRAFNFLVQLIAVPGLNDTQCGFKGFRTEVALDIFSRTLLYQTDQVVRGPRVTAFDVELLFIARKRKYSIVEIPVSWTHVSGSKVNPLLDSLRMLGDVVRVRLNSILGRYNLEDES